MARDTFWVSLRIPAVLLLSTALQGCGITILRTEENGVIHAYAIGVVEETITPPSPQSPVSGIGLTTFGASAITSGVSDALAFGYTKSTIFEIQNNSNVTIDRGRIP